MTERLKHMGRLKERQIQAKEIKSRLDGLRDGIRDVWDPFEEHENLKAEQGAAQAVEYAALQAQYKEVLAEIAAIKKALGL